jgi:hypothetical protein
MEKDEKITSENEVVKEYHVPELVDLNGINETQERGCTNGSSDGIPCDTGNTFF